MAGSRSLRGFWSLVATQFQGAFSDNAFKTLIIFLVLGDQVSSGGRELVLFIGALFAVPFILFSMAGGYLADRFSKKNVTVGTKLLEIAVMALALVGLAAGSMWIEVLAVFLMSLQSALFGPSKYGILPDLLPEKLLSWGNGVVSLGTFLAIITGTVAGGLLAEVFPSEQVWSGAVFVGLGVVGLVTAFGITPLPAANPKRTLALNFVADLLRQIRVIRRDRVLYLAVLGNTYFYFLAALLQFNILFYGLEILEVGETLNSLLLAAVALGIGAGSLAAGYLSGKKIEYGLIPLGSIGITVLGAILYREGLGYREVAFLLGLLGFFSGFFIVPLSALIQHRPPESRRGGVIAASNLLSFVGILLSSAVYYLFAALQLDPRGIFLASALVTVGATVYVFWLLPDSLLRFLLWMLTHTVYRIRVMGRDNIPEKGGALFVSNHLSFIDALLLIASTDRFVRFLVFKGYYEHWLIKPFARMMRAIPISSDIRPREMIRSLREARQSVVDGEVVCIFAEGQITRIGQMLPFRRGFERIMHGLEAPIIPVNLAGVWGSIFSFERGRFLWKLPRRLFAPVVISFGKPMPTESSSLDVRQAVQELHTDSYGFHKDTMKPIGRLFVSTARRHPLRFAMADHEVTGLRYGSVLARTIFLARRLKAALGQEEMVGVLLPPSVGGAVTNLALLMMGRVPVNLNYTASNEVLASCSQQCGIKQVLTSKRFLEKVPLKVPGEPLLLEEVAGDPRALERSVALIMASLLPVRWLELLLGCRTRKSPDALATVIFSSGSTGDPKGVLLSEYNIGSNVEQLSRIFSLSHRDRIMGLLPFFHSFGFTGTLVLPVALGLGIVYHPSPLDARAIGAQILEYAVTFLLATPTFLNNYTRRCTPEQFGSLQYVLTGAEKLPEKVSIAFEDKFGIRPLEGYGCTECSPVVSVNTRDFRAAGFRQVGAKRMSIGHPLPGISVRIVDPDTRQPLPYGEPGLLLVKGPNVMQGYLGRPEKTAEVLENGWYCTGDIAAVDEDGFLRITDRLSRFSKIGGEMVPHIKIEEVLQEASGEVEQCFCVTAVPDPGRGERLVVLHTVAPDVLAAAIDHLQHSELPKLWLPKADQFFALEQLPYLGTGKLDLRRVKELAAACASAQA